MQFNKAEGFAHICFRGRFGLTVDPKGRQGLSERHFSLGIAERFLVSKVLHFRLAASILRNTREHIL